MDDIKNKIKEQLIFLADDKYKNFQSKLCPGVSNILGVSVPKIRKLAKNLLNDYSFYELFDNVDSEYYEEIMLKGILIGNCIKDLDEAKFYTSLFVPLIDNWAVCDSFCSNLKIVKKYKEEFRDFILDYGRSSNEFEIRFAVVMILNYYVESDYLQDNFDFFESISSNDYYVIMSIAWALSICFIKFFDETFEFFVNSNIDTFVYNMTILKVCDSYRVEGDKKKMLKMIKR